MAPNFDVVIVGAGAGGGAMAWRLCTQGARVLLLDAGPRFDPAEDYPLTEAGWERKRFPEKQGSRARITYGDLGRLDPKDADLASWDSVAGRHFTTPDRQVGNGYSHVRGIGGSTLHFVGEAHRMHPDAMSLRTRFGAGADWPLTYADIEPHYATCERVIGVAGPDAANAPKDAPTDARWRSTPYPLPAHPLSPSAQRLADVGGRIGMAWQANSRAALSAPYDDRPNCNYCGNCSRGCPLGDKGSTDVTFIRQAEATGRLTIKANASVIRIEPSKSGQIAAIHYVQNGQAVRQETPMLVLAAGAVQTPRLLLASVVANSSGQVGRNFMETLSWASSGLAPDLSMSHAGLPADAISWTYNAPDSVPDAVGGCRFNSGTQEIGFVGPIAYAQRLIDGHGAGFKTRLREAFGTAISVGAIGETLPDARSFVDLDPTEVDENGVPLPRIQSVLTDNSLALLHFMADRARALLAEAGVTQIREEVSSWDSLSATHVFGTCRMGTGADTSVVDAFCRSHDHANLFITDASVFPSSGGGESPSLTIQALALRAADHLLS